MVKFFCLIGIILIGFLLRLGGINYGLPGKNQALTTYHPDEPKSYYTLERMKKEKTLHPGDGLFWGSFHLYTLGLTLQTAKMAGYVQAPSRQFLIENLNMADRLYKTGRLLSVFFGTLSIFLIYLISQQLNFKIVIPAKAGIQSLDQIKPLDSRFRGNDNQDAQCSQSFFSLITAALLALSPVHIINSFIVRPDVMMISLALGCMYLAFLAMETNAAKYFIFSGFCAGLAAATKYNGGVFLIFPILAFIIQNGFSMILFWIGGAAAFGFILGCPYALIDPSTFFSYLRDNASLAEAGASMLIYGSGWKSYVTTFLPLGLGWLTTLLGFAGFVVMASQIWKNKQFLVFLTAFIVIYFITSWPRHQMVWYTLPVVPFIIIFAGTFLEWLFNLAKKFKLVWLYVSALILILGYNTVYALAYLNLYRSKNVREMASEWISANVPQGETIAIARSYFWTPGILRQYHPPYRVIEGGSSQSVPDQAFLGLKDIAKRANYLVLTEFEYRNYLHPKLQSLLPEQTKILEEITQKDYQEIARFDEEARFLWFRFPKGEFFPSDWIMPNPAIKIYRKKN